MIMRYRWWLALTLAGLAGCASPEATRVRGVGPGLILATTTASPSCHAGAKIYYRTPCRTVKVKCTGPMPVFRRTRNGRDPGAGRTWPAATAPSPKPGSGFWEAALSECEDGATWEARRTHHGGGAAHQGAGVVSGPDDGRWARARRWVRRLLKLTPQVNPRRIDGLELLEAAVCHDDARIDALAAAGGGGAEPHTLRVLGQMAVLPLLQACARGLASQLPPTWWEGYCPLCGAWPVVAEYTGLERKRRLRCGRCGTAMGDPAAALRVL